MHTIKGSPPNLTCMLRYLPMPHIQPSTRAALSIPRASDPAPPRIRTCS